MARPIFLTGKVFQKNPVRMQTAVTGFSRGVRWIGIAKTGVSPPSPPCPNGTLKPRLTGRGFSFVLL